MKRLTEREIQEKLYGKYHRQSPLAPTKPEAPPQPKTEPRPVEPKVEVQQELPLGLKEEKPAPLKKKIPSPRKKTLTSPKGAQPCPITSNQARFFVLSFLAIGLILLLFSLKPNSRSQKPDPVKPAPSKAVSQAIPPAPTESKRFTLQTIVYAKRDQAELFVQDLKKKNLQASIEEDTSGKGQTRYLVLVGEFPTAQEAAKSLETLTRTYPELFRGSFVRKTR